ncbi:MAG: 50S ribosomal protein L30e [Candidatus Heimdallarchaeota archaeon]
MEKGELDRAVKIVMRTGKMEWGWKKAKQAVLRGGVELLIVAANIPMTEREELRYYATLGGIPIVEYPGTSWELGEVCGRPHMIMVLMIRDVGDSKLKELGTRSTNRGEEGDTRAMKSVKAE